MAYYTTPRLHDILSGITFFQCFLLGLVVIGGLGVDITRTKYRKSNKRIYTAHEMLALSVPN